MASDGTDVGLEVSTTGKILVADRNDALVKHYPYDCPRSHCSQSEDRCVAECCRRKLSARMEVLRESLHELELAIVRLVEDIRGLREEIVKRWADTPR